MKNIYTIFIIFLSIGVHISLAQTTSEFAPNKDNSIFSESQNSSGVGKLYTGKNSAGNLRRSLIHFDVSSIPANANIENVTLSVDVEKNGPSSTSSDKHYIYGLSNDWGEGISNPSGGSGAPAVAPDATWTDNMFGSSVWTTPGGDYINTEISTTNFTTLTGDYVFPSTAEFISLVQSWVENSSNNYGVILLSEESTSGTARRFGSKDAGTPPTLTITYTTGTGIYKHSLNKIQLVNNPIKDYAVFKINRYKNIISYRITDIYGNTINQKNNDRGEQLKINFSSFATGLYFISLIEKNGNYENFKIVKQ